MGQSHFFFFRKFLEESEDMGDIQLHV
jgi:hypothetical protein